ncbi:MAG: hypothetical protein ACE5E7_02180 [Anaerolineae bacterium]
MGIQPAGGEFLARRNFLPAFPPLGVLGCVGNRLWAGFGLGDLCAFARFSV